MSNASQKREERLISAINTMADIINKMAAAMNSDINDGNIADIKQLKELTLTAKELAAVMKSVDSQKNDDTEKVSVSFDDESEKWAT